MLNCDKDSASLSLNLKSMFVTPGLLFVFELLLWIGLGYCFFLLAYGFQLGGHFMTFIFFIPRHKRY